MTKLFGPSEDGIDDKPAARLVRPRKGRSVEKGGDQRRQTGPEAADTGPGTDDPQRSRSEPAVLIGAPPVVDVVPRDESGTAAGVEGDVRAAGADRGDVAVHVQRRLSPEDDDPADATREPSTSARTRSPVRSIGWKRLLVALAGLAVLFSVGRGLVDVGGGDDEAVDTTGPGPGSGQTGLGEAPKGTSETAPRPNRTTPVNPAVVDGRLIRPAGTVLTLNPALAQPGALIGVSGIGFDARSTVDLWLTVKGVKGRTGLGSVKVDRHGGLNAEVTMPQQLSGGTAVVTAQQRGSDKVATAAAMGASGIGFVELGEGQQSGKPGDVISLSARGFAPGEKIKVYWGRASGPPAATLTADGGGGVREASVRVGTGAVGNASIVLVGADSSITATAPFFLLGLYPHAAATPYAVKAKQVLTLSGSGFAPDERVLVYINASAGRPLMTAQADGQGNVGGVGFEVPYGLRGAQSVVMVGELSRASVSSGFEILPYTPSAQPSTYGGSPGTTFSFYATGFGPHEVVEVYLGRGQGNPGELVTAFRVDEQGNANAAGSYMIQSGQQGKLTFALLGRQSGSDTTATVSVTPASGTVDLPPSPKYTLPPHLAVDTPRPSRERQAPGTGGKAR